MAQIKHIGLIPDGNRRWALANSLDYSVAYIKTMENIVLFTEYAYGKGIDSVSVYLLSTDNLERKREDLSAVLSSILVLIRDMIINICHSYNCRVVHAGNLELLPVDVSDAINKLCSITKHNNKVYLNLLIGYNPLNELNYAISSCNCNKITLDDLWVSQMIDCIIRTGGGPTMISNFLPIQSGYAQIYMLEKFFNDFIKEDFDNIYNKASSIKMLYGR